MKNVRTRRIAKRRNCFFEKDQVLLEVTSFFGADLVLLKRRIKRILPVERPMVIRIPKARLVRVNSIPHFPMSIMRKLRYPRPRAKERTKYSRGERAEGLLRKALKTKNPGTKKKSGNGQEKNDGIEKSWHGVLLQNRLKRRDVLF